MTKFQTQMCGERKRKAENQIKYKLQDGVHQKMLQFYSIRKDPKESLDKMMICSWSAGIT